MIIGAVKETEPGEKRVAATPQSVKKLTQLGYDVIVESGCGQNAHFPDPLYEAAGATVATKDAVLTESDILLKISPPPPVKSKA